MSEDLLADYAVGSPTRLALNVLAHKWTLLIVLALKGGPLGRCRQVPSADHAPVPVPGLEANRRQRGSR